VLVNSKLSCDAEFFRLTRRKREGVVSYVERETTKSGGKITVTFNLPTIPKKLVQLYSARQIISRLRRVEYNIFSAVLKIFDYRLANKKIFCYSKRGFRKPSKKKFNFILIIF